MNIENEPLAVGSTAFFMPWKDIVISDEIIKIHKHLYEFKHIQGRYEAYATLSELEINFKLLLLGERHG